MGGARISNPTHTPIPPPNRRPEQVELMEQFWNISENVNSEKLEVLKETFLKIL